MEDARIEGIGGGGFKKYEVDCLKVKKVYFSCQLRECIEDQLFDLDYPTGNSCDYKFVRCEFGDASIEPIKHVPLFTEVDEYYAKLRGVVAVPIYVVVRRKCDGEIFKLAAHPIIDGCEQKDNKVRFPIDVIVYAPANFLRQGRFIADAESLAECDHNLVRFIGSDNIELSIGFFIIIKVLSEVQLKIPTFGFCEIPEPCDEVAPISDVFCELFLNEELTPFPQDFFPPQRHQVEDIEDITCPPKKPKRC
ncbi:hypothetical protein GC105_10905 [Alkalibaculum sp. M08DMB]|uniref:Uncharacterized protein n=1 Tax=Alkalibaculum sporogenes TaxID=2655001 RepID=A0A6A7KAT8_9FIRM|nr:hypothetical protein [Alkalibaculum sporogenes]MPW26297.1 hypothetical protein [Alkalibaculum sporogenes]